MCKKLIFVLAMVMMVVPASAQMAHPDKVILKVDVDAFEAVTTQPDWVSWQMPSYWSSFGPVVKNFGYNPTLPWYENLPIVKIDGFRRGLGGGNFGGSRSRYTGENMSFGKVHQDLAYIAASGGGLGYDYMSFDINLGPACANRAYEFTFWTFDKAFQYSGELPGTKLIAWSETNPATWLAANYPDPNGYPAGAMPAGLEALLLGRSLQNGTEPDAYEFDDVYGMTYSVSFEVTLDENGQASIYGWSDLTDWTGSQHMSFNGFALSIPEPATVALLGLGGLALLRRRKR